MLSLLRIALLAGVIAWPDDGGAQAPASPASAAEIAFWESVRDSSDPAEIAAYLKTFPNGQFAPLARIRLNRLKASTPQPQDAATSPPTGAPPNHAAKVDVPPPPAAKPRGWIGAELRGLTEQRARELGVERNAGAEVVRVVDFGPSVRSGLRAGDVIVSVDGKSVTDMQHIIRLVSARQPGERLTLKVRRGAARQTLQLAIGNFFLDQWSAAHHNNLVAIVELANIYRLGTLVDKDEREAVKWYRRAAELGHAGAAQVVGRAYQYGRGVQQDFREAVRWYLKAANGGNAEAMFALGLLHLRGQGAARDDKRAAHWFKLAADKSHRGAIHNYGDFLNRGQGVPQDQAAAVAYFRQGAKLGQPESFTALGNAYYGGFGVPKNLQTAVQWYREAAQRGQIDGMAKLGQMHERGEGGLPANRAEAIKHYRKAAEGDSDFARERLKALRVTVYDPEELQRLLAELGFDPGAIDGRPGRQTRDAIRAFQQSVGISVDGQQSMQLVGRLREEKRRRTAAAEQAASGGGGVERTDQNVQPSPPVAKPDFDKLKQLDTAK